MIINNTLFVDEYYIPHARPSITNDITTVDAKASNFISKYVRECLIKTLGTRMAVELISNLEEGSTDISNVLKSTADQKWRDLVYGVVYTNPQGESREWRGILYKEFGADVYKSFLVPYVYWHYEQNADSFQGGAAIATPNVKNARVASASPKVTKAFRDFVTHVQGLSWRPDVFSRNGAIGVDWYLGGAVEEISLYQYITDMSNVKTNTDLDKFEKFQGQRWEMPNQFGI